MQDQLNSILTSLQNFASTYLDPGKALANVPYVKDNPELLAQISAHKFIILGGLFVLVAVLRILRKRRSSEGAPAKTQAQPTGQGDQSDKPAKPKRAFVLGRKAKPETEPTAEVPQPRANLAKLPRPKRKGAVPALETRSLSNQLEDIEAVKLVARPALRPNEARMRVMLQSAITLLDMPLMVMARTSLAALLAPGQEVEGPLRAQVVETLKGQSLDFGLFDRAGRLVLAIDIAEDGDAQRGNPIVATALAQAGIKTVSMAPGTRPAEIAALLSPYLGVLATPQIAEQTPATPAAPSRPVRPVRRIRPAA